MENQLVVFDLADEYYGVDIAALEGIINLRGNIAPNIGPGCVVAGAHLAT